MIETIVRQEVSYSMNKNVNFSQSVLAAIALTQASCVIGNCTKVVFILLWAIMNPLVRLRLSQNYTYVLTEVLAEH